MLEGKSGQQFIARPLLLNEQYFAWNVLDRYYEHCRKEISKPYRNSDFYEDLPINLIGNWESSGAEKVQLSFYSDYTFAQDQQKSKIKQFSYLPSRKRIHFEFMLEGERRLWSLSPSARGALKSTDLATRETTTFLKTSEVSETTAVKDGVKEYTPYFFWAVGVAMGLIIALIVLLRTRRREAKKKEFV